MTEKANGDTVEIQGILAMDSLEEMKVKRSHTRMTLVAFSRLRLPVLLRYTQTICSRGEMAGSSSLNIPM